jgi:hypothetical protein
MTASIPFCILCQIHLAELRGCVAGRGWVCMGGTKTQPKIIFKIGPKLSPKSLQKRPQNRTKIVLKIVLKSSPKSLQKHPQNLAKIVPKSTSKSSSKLSQNHLKIVPKSFQNRGWVWEGMDGHKWATCIPPGYLFCDRVLKEY